EIGVSLERDLRRRARRRLDLAIGGGHSADRTLDRALLLPLLGLGGQPAHRGARALVAEERAPPRGLLELDLGDVACLGGVDLGVHGHGLDLSALPCRWRKRNAVVDRGVELWERALVRGLHLLAHRVEVVVELGKLTGLVARRGRCEPCRVVLGAARSDATAAATATATATRTAATAAAAA